LEVLGFFIGFPEPRLSRLSVPFLLEKFTAPLLLRFSFQNDSQPYHFRVVFSSPGLSLIFSLCLLISALSSLQALIAHLLYKFLFRNSSTLASFVQDCSEGNFPLSEASLLGIFLEDDPIAFFCLPLHSPPLLRRTP